MNILPVDRALIIYGALADRSETKGARERLFQHLMKMHIEGEKDEHRLTMEGLSYLHNLNREIDSRNWTRAAFCPFGRPVASAIAHSRDGDQVFQAMVIRTPSSRAGII